jgi:hypothetical protein
MRNLRSRRLGLSLSLLLGCGAVAFAQAGNFVTNPTFAPTSAIQGNPLNYAYDPVVPGWTFSPLVPAVSGAGIAGFGSNFGFTAPPSGDTWVAFLQIDSASVSQEITGLTPGNVYDLTFSLEGRPSTGAPATTVTIGGTTVLSGVTPGDSGWTSYNDFFTATSSEELLIFSTSQPSLVDTTTGVDHPSITFVPEGGESSFYLVVAGVASFGAMFFTSRNRMERGTPA